MNYYRHCILFVVTGCTTLINTKRCKDACTTQSFRVSMYTKFQAMCPAKWNEVKIKYENIFIRMPDLSVSVVLLVFGFMLSNRIILCMHSK